MKEFDKWIEELSHAFDFKPDFLDSARIGWKAALEWVLEECRYGEGAIDIIEKEFDF